LPLKSRKLSVDSKPISVGSPPTSMLSPENKAPKQLVAQSSEYKHKLIE